MTVQKHVDYRQIFTSAPALFLVLAPDARFTIVDASDAYLSATFTERDRLIGHGVFDVLPKEPAEVRAPAAAKLRESLERVAGTGRAETMAVQRFDIERPAAEGGGSVERFWSAVNAPVHAPDGRLLYIVHSIQDVTDFVETTKSIEADTDSIRLELLKRGQQLAAANAQLREVVSQFQAMYDQGLFAGRLDLEGRVMDVNRSSLELCGYTHAEVIGKPFWECGWWNRSQDVQAWVKTGVAQAIRGDAFRGVSTYYLADGSERVVDFTCMPIKDEGGKVLFVFPTGMDITERVAVERNLRASDILESITDGFFALDRDWCFTYVNREAQRILGRGANELVGRVIWQEYPGLVDTEFDAVYRRAMRTPGAASSVTAFYPDHQRWYEVHAYPAQEGITVYFRNVTARERAEEERQRLVAESERQRRMYEAALSNTPDLVYVFDLDHRFVYANEALLRMWGKTRDEAIGKNCLELGYEPWHAEMHDREIEQVVQTRLPIRGEVPFTGTEGRRIYDYIFVPVIGSKGNVVAVAGTTRDITDRQRQEQAIREQADALGAAARAKDEFLATLAHELRNPLAPLRNALHLLSASADPAARSLLQMMERQVNHLVRLVDDLLEVSRISRGELALKKERVDVAEVVRNAIETCEPLVESAHHTLQVSMPDERLRVEGDPVRLAQIVANLLNNAARYMPDGGTIVVSVRCAADVVVISVRDKGIGIAPEVLPHVFEMFSRGAVQGVRGDSGLGIGLALARRLAEMHGGSLEGRSGGLGKGSEFIVRLPLDLAPADQRDRADAGVGDERARDAAPGSLDELRDLRILVVDDNRDAAVSLAMVLEALGADVDIACSGPEALQRIEAALPTIVFLDIGMPVMDGYEVARRIRGRYRDAEITLVALTGWGQEEDRRKAREAGFDEHFVKPVDIGTLRDFVTARGPARARHVGSPAPTNRIRMRRDR